MKKLTIEEEIKRFHEITFGKTFLPEEDRGFLSRLFGKKKIDDPKKADFVTDDVTQFFKTLEDASNSGGLKQSERGSMNFQKEVESMQIGLKLLDPTVLPKYGVDGLYGPETAAAVKSFVEKNLSQQKTVNEVALSSPIGDTVITSPYGPRNGKTHHGIDLKADSGTPIKSPLDGQIIDAEIRADACGGTIRIQHADGLTSRYCHCKQINVKNGQSVKKGEIIGLTGGGQGDSGKGRSTGPHLHFELYKNGQIVNPVQYLGSEVGEFTGVNSGGFMYNASPEMLRKLLEMLKERGVKSEELKSFIDVGVTFVGEVTDKAVYEKILQELGAPITDENMKFMFAWRQAEGKGGKNNPFNTTQNMAGATNFNSVGVKNYLTISDGVNATLKTLKNGRYNCIINGLQQNIGASEIAKCQSLKTWGTGDLVATVLTGYDRGSKPKISSLA
jgi:peptidoglycan hydrolase-like protein with peptidoglycan-binding domain